MNYPTLSSQLLMALTAIMGINTLYFSLKFKTIILYWEITNLFASPLTLPIILDPMGLMFSTTVLFISTNVMYFSNTYMKGDPFINRFILLVLAFVLSMNLLIFLPHLMALLLGWDGLGLISFLLVIYYQNGKSLAGGMITALTNRIGDAFLLMAIAWSMNQNHWMITNMWTHPMSTLLSACILIAAMTKSAQIPFSSWLPAAMAAPTPVSSLVHSSTLVTAGVFLLVRFYPSLQLMKWFNPCLLMTAALTMLMAGSAAMIECDLKKIIALSTLSQLGVMMTSLGLGYTLLTMFHLLTHALFKALLFLCAGNVIHTHLHGQDLRTVGNLTKQMPLTSSCMLIANMSLCGAPFLAGFFSKDLILELSMWAPTNMFIMVMFFIATALTSMYSMRFITYMLISPNYHYPLININEGDDAAMIPITMLTLGAVMGGATIFWIMYPLSYTPILPTHMKMFTMCMILFAALMTYLNMKTKTQCSTPMFNMTAILSSNSFMWFLTPLSSQMLLKPSLYMSHMFMKSLDQSWVEMNVSQSMNITFMSLSNKLQHTQKNTINTMVMISLLMFIPMMVMMT